MVVTDRELQNNDSSHSLQVVANARWSLLEVVINTGFTGVHSTRWSLLEVVINTGFSAVKLA